MFLSPENGGTKSSVEVFESPTRSVDTRRTRVTLGGESWLVILFIPESPQGLGGRESSVRVRRIHRKDEGVVYHSPPPSPSSFHVRPSVEGRTSVEKEQSHGTTVDLKLSFWSVSSVGGRGNWRSWRSTWTSSSETLSFCLSWNTGSDLFSFHSWCPSRRTLSPREKKKKPCLREN